MNDGSPRVIYGSGFRAQVQFQSSGSGFQDECVGFRGSGAKDVGGPEPLHPTCVMVTWWLVHFPHNLVRAHNMHRPERAWSDLLFSTHNLVLAFDTFDHDRQERFGRDQGSGLRAQGSGLRFHGFSSSVCRGTSLIRKRPPLGPYRSPMPGDLWRSYGGGYFL